MDSSTFFFILGYLINIGANGWMIRKITQDRHVDHLSFQTQIIFFVASISKCFYFNMTVLALHWLGWIELVASISSCAYLCYCFKLYKTTDAKETFTFTYFAVPICIALSVVFHPGFFEEGFDFPSMMIACGNYLEAVAQLPQLWKIKKQNCISRKLNIYLFLLVVSRLCRIVFWILLIWIEGGYFFTIILSDVIYIAQVSDLVYKFITNPFEDSLNLFI